MFTRTAVLVYIIKRAGALQKEEDHDPRRDGAGSAEAGGAAKASGTYRDHNLRGGGVKMEKRELTCIGCPLGCSLTVTLEGGHVRKVEGIPVKRARVWKERVHESYPRGDLHGPGERRDSAGGLGEDGRRYPKGKNQGDHAGP